MIILVFSQGYKFAVGDHVLFFPSGIFGDSGPGIVRGIVLNKSNDSEQYLVQYRRGNTGWGPKVRVPPNHIIAPYIVISDESAFRNMCGALMRNCQVEFGD